MGGRSDGPQTAGPCRSLQSKHLVNFKDGITEGSLLVWLTDEGRKGWELDRPYKPWPIESDEQTTPIRKVK